jgi:hypothetical protein
VDPVPNGFQDHKRFTVRTRLYLGLQRGRRGGDPRSSRAYPVTAATGLSPSCQRRRCWTVCSGYANSAVSRQQRDRRRAPSRLHPAAGQPARPRSVAAALAGLPRSVREVIFPRLLVPFGEVGVGKSLALASYMALLGCESGGHRHSSPGPARVTSCRYDIHNGTGRANPQPSSVGVGTSSGTVRRLGRYSTVVYARRALSSGLATVAATIW